MRLPICCILLLPLLGCSETRVISPPYSYVSPVNNSLALTQEFADKPGSLFPSDSQVIGNQALEQILAAHPTLPAHGRVAVLALEPRGLYYYWSEEISNLHQQATDKVLTRLRACPRVADASALPALLVPDRRTIPYLREAAARYQADLLLIYQASTSSFEKQKIIGPDQVKATCRVDAVLLDTRSGIVPFTTAVSREYKAQKTPADLNFEEAVQRTKLTALSEALGAVANDLAAFLEKLPVAGQDPASAAPAAR